jgi:3-oxoadipate enol-lactonase
MSNVAAGLAVEVTGSGTPVICVHGLGGTSNTFTPQLPALASMRVIRPDLPCAGRTANSDKLSITSIAATLVKLADVLGVKAALSAIRSARWSANTLPPSARSWCEVFP